MTAWDRGGGDADEKTLPQTWRSLALSQQWMQAASTKVTMPCLRQILTQFLVSSNKSKRSEWFEGGFMKATII